MRIQHNISALNSHRQLGTNNTAIGKNLEKLSSGFRINKAGDDAAGLAISEKMRAQIKGLETAQKNAQDGISLVQTAEGALTEVHSMLNRMVELATQSANGTYDDVTDRANLQKEVESLKSEIDRISESTNFNGIKLLDGHLGKGKTGGSDNTSSAAGAFEANAIDFSVEAQNAGITVKFAQAAGNRDASAAWNGSELTITLKSAASTTDTFTQEDIDNAIAKASGAPEIAKGLKVKLNKNIVTKQDASNNAALDSSVTTAEAQIAKSVGRNVNNTSGRQTSIQIHAAKAGADTRTVTVNTNNNVGGTVAAATGAVTLGLQAGKDYSADDINEMMKEAGTDITFSFEGRVKGSDIANGGAYQLANGAGLATGGGLELQVGDTNDKFQKVSVQVGNMSTRGLEISSISIADQDRAGKAISAIKEAINTVSSTRGDLGAIQNRLEHTINNLGVTTENMTAAESRIRDVDMAKEMMEFTKNNILSQAATSMLAQANQTPQGVLQLLN